MFLFNSSVQYNVLSVNALKIGYSGDVLEAAVFQNY